MSFSGLTIKTFIVLKRRYALSLRLRSLLSMGACFVFQLCAVFLEGSTLVAVHIKIIIALCRRTAQHTRILLAFHQKRAGWKHCIFDLTAISVSLIAKLHGIEIVQRRIRLFSQPVYGADNICLELWRVQHIVLVRPPSCEELLTAAKVAAQMADTASDLVLFLGLGVTKVVQRSVIGYEKSMTCFLLTGYSC